MAGLTPIIIATRGSALALAQAEMVLRQCQQLLPGQPCEIRIIKTTGDKLQTASLASTNLPKGLFTKELELALVRGEAHLAVHSLKDLPTELPDELVLGAVTQRADVRDVLLYRSEALAKTRGPAARGFPAGTTIASLPGRAIVATSSTRRAAQLLERRPDLEVIPIRGNVPTRLRKLADQPEIDAIILAAAGLERLQLLVQPDGRLEQRAPLLTEGSSIPSDICASIIPVETMLPCVGQAAIGIEVRRGDEVAAKVCAALNHLPTAQCVAAERAFLRAMGGGCQLAVAACATLDEPQLTLRGVSYLRGKPVRGEVKGLPAQGEQLGLDLARLLQGP